MLVYWWLCLPVGDFLGEILVQLSSESFQDVWGLELPAISDCFHDLYIHMEVSINGGTPIAGWFIMDNPIKIWMITRGTPIFLETSISRFIRYVVFACTWFLLICKEFAGLSDLNGADPGSRALKDFGAPTKNRGLTKKSDVNQQNDKILSLFLESSWTWFINQWAIKVNDGQSFALFVFSSTTKRRFPTFQTNPPQIRCDFTCFW